MAAQEPITHFEPDPERLEVIAECTKDWDIGEDENAEWPNNILSQRAIVYGSGRIARVGDEVSHAVDPDELALCRRLSSEVATLVAGMEVDMGSESGDEFRGFFIAGNVGEAVAGAISEAIIWERFGGTVFPPATITVEPLTEKGVWWSEVKYDGEDTEDDYLAPWRRMINWFKGRFEFVDTVFVRIGDSYHLSSLPHESWPHGTQLHGSVLPRLALGLTRGGSLVGLFGWSVQT